MRCEGAALAGYGAVTMTNALTATMGSLPAELARSLTWDRGRQMSAHAKFTAVTGIPVLHDLRRRTASG